MGQRLSDPSWKKYGPRDRQPTDSEHAIHPEDFGGDYDVDGFGRSEAERVDGEPLVVIQEVATCTRDGCDAAHTRRLLFTTDTLSDDEKHALDAASVSDSPGAYVYDNFERVDVETIEVALPEEAPQSADSETRHEVDDITITVEEVIETPHKPMGPCYGHEEPDPEPVWRDI